MGVSSRVIVLCLSMFLIKTRSGLVKTIKVYSNIMAQFIHPLLYNCPCQLSLSLSLHISNFCSSLNNKNQLISYPLHTHTRVDSSLLYNSFPFLPTNDQPGSYPQWQFYCIKKSYIKYYGHSTSTYKSIINSIIRLQQVLHL